MGDPDHGDEPLLQLLHHEDGRVAEVVLDRPRALNALSTRMVDALAGVLGRLGADPAVRAVVLSSSSARAFCVGADLKERAGFDDAALLAQRPRFRAAFAALLAVPVPVVAAVRGHALGGGYELALSCDVVVAEPSAVVGLPEVGVGLVPGCGGTQLLPRRVGAGRAAELVLTGRTVGGEEALRLGLVDVLAAPGGALGEARAVAARAAAASPVAVRAAKRALRRGADADLATGLEVEDAAWRTAALSADRREGVAAFAERRAPRWTGA
ncbi:enoyl-CoA hydratase/isomerase family protein [Vallicoccus soli]|uniref:enoyl-CoA hydratase n=1 Tax=Vallicoccus soli TaxID=2339232 RepID=A0A3A3Z1F1_9ACTN|nr:enoyl-CoA hydratase/isomerase family protein [Vallicoccus soli]RJK95318.1 enoyl-CoA hydratase/isomerase family protein [Vallicoccus soli]